MRKWYSTWRENGIAAVLASTGSPQEVSGMPYLRRSLDIVLDELIPDASAIAIDGPKGVGKTDTALQRTDITWYLDQPEFRDLASSDF